MNTEPTAEARRVAEEIVLKVRQEHHAYVWGRSPIPYPDKLPQCDEQIARSIATALAEKNAEIEASRWCAKVADNEKAGRLLAEKEAKELRTERDNLKAEVDRLTIQFGTCSVCGFVAWKERGTREHCQYCALKAEVERLTDDRAKGAKLITTASEVLGDDIALKAELATIKALLVEICEAGKPFALAADMNRVERQQMANHPALYRKLAKALSNPDVVKLVGGESQSREPVDDEQKGPNEP